ncbi:MAG: hypothetical protein QGH51_07460 [Planctomycetota bacterium]|nr:hypothetical protein [Planctomycetota bacterium]
MSVLPVSTDYSRPQSCGLGWFSVMAEGLSALRSGSPAAPVVLTPEDHFSFTQRTPFWL